MKRNNILAWAVAVILVLITGVSVIHVHQAESANKIVVDSEMSSSSSRDKKTSEISSEQEDLMRKPISWNKPSQTAAYPDVSGDTGRLISKKKLKHMSKKKREKTMEKLRKRAVYLVAVKSKQRLYVMRNGYVLYTMYASISKNYDHGMRFYDKTPTGGFTIGKKRGKHYYDGIREQGANYWTSYGHYGRLRIESVGVDAHGKVLPKAAKQLGRKVTKKHNVKAAGAIVVSQPDAKWIYENIKKGTKLYIADKPSNLDYLAF